MLLATITAALSSIGFMLMQPVLAAPTDPCASCAFPFSPGYRSQTTEIPANQIAPGTTCQPGDPCRNLAPGYLLHHDVATPTE